MEEYVSKARGTGGKKKACKCRIKFLYVPKYWTNAIIIYTIFPSSSRFVNCFLAPDDQDLLTQQTKWNLSELYPTFLKKRVTNDVLWDFSSKDLEKMDIEPPQIKKYERALSKMKSTDQISSGKELLDNSYNMLNLGIYAFL